MFISMLAMIPQFDTVVGGGGGGGGEPPAPTISNMTLTHFAGVCTNHNLTVNANVGFNWTETNFNSSLHEHRVYQDNVLLSTFGTGTSYLKQIPGVVQDGCGASWQSDWVFRVDIVRKSDSVVLASATVPGNVNDHWMWYYGTCC